MTDATQTPILRPRIVRAWTTRPSRSALAAHPCRTAGAGARSTLWEKVLGWSLRLVERQGPPWRLLRAGFAS